MGKNGKKKLFNAYVIHIEWLIVELTNMQLYFEPFHIYNCIDFKSYIFVKISYIIVFCNLIIMNIIFKVYLFIL